MLKVIPGKRIDEANKKHNNDVIQRLIDDTISGKLVWKQVDGADYECEYDDNILLAIWTSGVCKVLSEITCSGINNVSSADYSTVFALNSCVSTILR